MTKSKRIDYLDMAKGIGILLVIIAHISYVSEPVRQYISTFHMPLFFVISGILLGYKQEETNSLRSLVVRKFKGLMLPYFICSACVLLIESGRILWKDANTWENILRQGFQSLCLQGVSVLWFLPALFVAELVFICLRKKSSHLGTVILLVVLCGIAYCGSEFAQGYFAEESNLKAQLCYDVVSMIFRNLFCVGFVGIGYYLARLLFGEKSLGMVEIPLAIILLILTGGVLRLNGAVDLRGMNLGNIVLFWAGGTAGSAGVILLCRALEKLPIKFLQRFLIFMGCNSLLIMVTHLDFRVLYISIQVAEWMNDNIMHNRVLFCISIVFFVILIEAVLIGFVNICKNCYKAKNENS